MPPRCREMLQLAPTHTPTSRRSGSSRVHPIDYAVAVLFPPAMGAALLRIVSSRERRVGSKIFRLLSTWPSQSDQWPSLARALSVSFNFNQLQTLGRFHGGNTSSNPVGDAKCFRQLKGTELARCMHKKEGEEPNLSVFELTRPSFSLCASCLRQTANRGNICRVKI